MSENTAWVTKYFAPALGTLIANAMWVTPIKVMRDARRNRELGNINPIPFNVVVANCLAYTMYSILKQDYFIFFSNFFGILISVSCILTTLMLLSKETPNKFESSLRDLVEYLFVGTLAFWLVILLFVGLVLNGGGGVSDSLVGTLAVICSIAYYAAPLSTMARVIRKKDASSLYLPLVLVNLVNAVLWFVYGLAGINDIYVWLPNVLGIALALSQVGLVIWYGSSPQKVEDALATHGTDCTSKPHPGITRFSSYWVPKEESKPLTRFQSFSRAVSSFFRPASSQQPQGQDNDSSRKDDEEEEEGIAEGDNQIIQLHGSSGGNLSSIHKETASTTAGLGDVEMKHNDTMEEREEVVHSVKFGISGTNTSLLDTCSTTNNKV